jgi:hypothetical protein
VVQEVGSGKSRRGRPIELGGALVTLVEPHKGHEVEYNRWYERDHFYAGCMIGAWTISGARYVCTRDLKALRYPESSPVVPDNDTGTYLALYWVLNGRFGEWIQWGTEQVKWLIAEDRMFPHRDHIHTLMYKYRGEFEDHDAEGVPVELALDHRSPYLVMIVGEPAADAEPTAIDAWFRARGLGAAVGASFDPIAMHAGAPSDVPRDEATDRFLHLWFVDDDLPAVWEERFAGLGAAFEESGLGSLVFVSPFRATVPGTDTFTDQLW